MGATPSILVAVSEQFPDLKPEEAKQLVLKSLNWLMTVGSMAAKRLELNEADAILERRAQAIAFGVLSRMLLIKSEDEKEQLDAITSIMDTITNAAPAPMGN